MKNNKHFFNPNLLDILLIINQIQIISCISYTKGTILKANHNSTGITISPSTVVFHIPKVQF